MAKAVRTIVLENGMNVDDINSFKTENYIGIFSVPHNDFLVFCKSDNEFWPDILKYEYGAFSNFEEFDNAVYEICEEHILEAFTGSSYAITLTGEE